MFRPQDQDDTWLNLGHIENSRDIVTQVSICWGTYPQGSNDYSIDGTFHSPSSLDFHGYILVLRVVVVLVRSYPYTTWLKQQVLTEQTCDEFGFCEYQEKSVNGTAMEVDPE